MHLIIINLFFGIILNKISAFIDQNLLNHLHNFLSFLNLLYTSYKKNKLITYSTANFYHKII